METRFLSKVDKQQDGCWKWKGNKDRDGYGLFWCLDNNRRAHRVAYEMWKGVIPQSLVVRHMCFSMDCVNPDHLQVGTQQDNINDTVLKRRHAHRETHPKSKGKMYSYEMVSDVLFSKEKQRTLAAKYALSESVISKIVNGTHWTLLPEKVRNQTGDERIGRHL